MLILVNMTHERQRQFEGPPELLWDKVNERDLRDPRGMPGGKSPEALLTFKYGEKGVGWDTTGERYKFENSFKRAAHEAGSKVVKEAFDNLQHTGEFILNDGKDMTGRLQRTVPEADTVDVVVYPDGKVYAAEHDRL
jgi:hypothetical protein